MLRCLNYLFIYLFVRSVPSWLYFFIKPSQWVWFKLFHTILTSRTIVERETECTFKYVISSISK